MPRKAPVTYAEARLRHELAKAEAQEMENARQRGELVPAAEVRDALIRWFASANAKLGAFPARWAHVIRPDDPNAARRHLEVAVEELRAELRRMPERIEDAPA